MDARRLQIVGEDAGLGGGILEDIETFEVVDENVGAGEGKNREVAEKSAAVCSDGTADVSALALDAAEEACTKFVSTPAVALVKSPAVVLVHNATKSPLRRRWNKPLNVAELMCADESLGKDAAEGSLRGVEDAGPTNVTKGGKLLVLSPVRAKLGASGRVRGRSPAASPGASSRSKRQRVLRRSPRASPVYASRAECDCVAEDDAVVLGKTLGFAGASVEFEACALAQSGAVADRGRSPVTIGATSQSKSHVLDRRRNPRLGVASGMEECVGPESGALAGERGSLIPREILEDDLEETSVKTSMKTAARILAKSTLKAPSGSRPLQKYLTPEIGSESEPEKMRSLEQRGDREGIRTLPPSGTTRDGGKSGFRSSSILSLADLKISAKSPVRIVEKVPETSPARASGPRRGLKTRSASAVPSEVDVEADKGITLAEQSPKSPARNPMKSAAGNESPSSFKTTLSRSSKDAAKCFSRNGRLSPRNGPALEPISDANGRLEATAWQQVPRVKSVVLQVAQVKSPVEFASNLSVKSGAKDLNYSSKTGVVAEFVHDASLVLDVLAREHDDATVIADSRVVSVKSPAKAAANAFVRSPAKNPKVVMCADLGTDFVPVGSGGEPDDVPKSTAPRKVSVKSPVKTTTILPALSRELRPKATLFDPKPEPLPTAIDDLEVSTRGQTPMAESHHHSQGFRESPVKVVASARASSPAEAPVGVLGSVPSPALESNRLKVRVEEEDSESGSAELILAAPKSPANVFSVAPAEGSGIGRSSAMGMRARNVALLEGEVRPEGHASQRNDHETVRDMTGSERLHFARSRAGVISKLPVRKACHVQVPKSSLEQSAPIPMAEQQVARTGAYFEPGNGVKTLAAAASSTCPVTTNALPSTGHFDSFHPHLSPPSSHVEQVAATRAARENAGDEENAQLVTSSPSQRENGLSHSLTSHLQTSQGIHDILNSADVSPGLPFSAVNYQTAPGRGGGDAVLLAAFEPSTGREVTAEPEGRPTGNPQELGKHRVGPLASGCAVRERGLPSRKSKKNMPQSTAKFQEKGAPSLECMGSLPKSSNGSDPLLGAKALVSATSSGKEDRDEPFRDVEYDQLAVRSEIDGNEDECALKSQWRKEPKHCETCEDRIDGAYGAGRFCGSICRYKVRTEKSGQETPLAKSRLAGLVKRSKKRLRRSSRSIGSGTFATGSKRGKPDDLDTTRANKRARHQSEDPLSDVLGRPEKNAVTLSKPSSEKLVKVRCGLCRNLRKLSNTVVHPLLSEESFRLCSSCGGVVLKRLQRFCKFNSLGLSTSSAVPCSKLGGEDLTCEDDDDADNNLPSVLVHGYQPVREIAVGKQQAEYGKERLPSRTALAAQRLLSVADEMIYMSSASELVAKGLSLEFVERVKRAAGTSLAHELDIPSEALPLLCAVYSYLGLSFEKGKLCWPAEGIPIPTRDVVTPLIEMSVVRSTNDRAKRLSGGERVWNETFPGVPWSRETPGPREVFSLVLDLVGIALVPPRRSSGRRGEVMHLDNISVSIAMHNAYDLVGDVGLQALLDSPPLVIPRAIARARQFAIETRILDDPTSDQVCCCCGSARHEASFPFILFSCSGCSKHFCSLCLHMVFGADEFHRAVGSSYNCRSCRLAQKIEALASARGAGNAGDVASSKSKQRGKEKCLSKKDDFCRPMPLLKVAKSLAAVCLGIGEISSSTKTMAAVSFALKCERVNLRQLGFNAAGASLQSLQSPFCVQCEAPIYWLPATQKVSSSGEENRLQQAIFCSVKGCDSALHSACKANAVGNAGTWRCNGHVCKLCPEKVNLSPRNLIRCRACTTCFCDEHLPPVKTVHLYSSKSIACPSCAVRLEYSALYPRQLTEIAAKQGTQSFTVVDSIILKDLEFKQSRQKRARSGLSLKANLQKLVEDEDFGPAQLTDGVRQKRSRQFYSTFARRDRAQQQWASRD